MLKSLLFFCFLVSCACVCLSTVPKLSHLLVSHWHEKPIYPLLITFARYSYEQYHQFIQNFLYVLHHFKLALDYSLLLIFTVLLYLSCSCQMFDLALVRMFAFVHIQHISLDTQLHASLDFSPNFMLLIVR